MKCNNCGTELTTEHRFCPLCGENNEAYIQQKINNNYQPAPKTIINQPINRVPLGNPSHTTSAPVYQTTTQPSVIPTLRLSKLSYFIRGLMAASIAVLGLAILPLAWGIPMLSRYCDSKDTGEPISTEFIIATFLLVNPLVAILIIIDEAMA